MILPHIAVLNLIAMLCRLGINTKDLVETHETRHVVTYEYEKLYNFTAKHHRL